MAERHFVVGKDYLWPILRLSGIGLFFFGLTFAGCSDPAPEMARPTDEEIQLLQEIDRLHEDGRFREGIEVARGYLAEHPRAPLFHYALGALLGSIDDQRGAIAELETELEIRPHHFDTLLAMATAYTLLGELEGSIPFLEQCRRLRPEHAGTAYQLGRNLSDLGRLAEAEPHLDRAVELEPGAKNLSELGKLYQRQGNDIAAEASFRRAVAKDPSYPAALYNLGQALLRLGRLEEGRELLALHEQQATAYDRFDAAKQSSQLQGSTAGNFLILARENLDRGDLVAAAAAYQRAVELAPGLPAPALGLAAILLEQDRIEEATRWAVLALSLDPSRSRSHFVLGIIRLHRGENRAAAVDLATAKHLGEFTPDMYLHLGETHRELGNIDAALDAYQQALALDPESDPAFTGMGLLRLQQGSPEEAIENLEQAIHLDSDQGEAWMALAIAYFHSGDRAMAESAFVSALATQRIALLEEGGKERIVKRFALLPDSEKALELYRELRDSR